MGNWCAELKSANANDILTKYLQPSLEALKKVDVSDAGDFDDNAKQRPDAYAGLARFCDAQFKQINEYMQSKEYEEKLKLMEKIQQEASHM